MKDFFLDKFEYDFYATKNWITCIEEQEDLVSKFTLQSISHVINVHHIWNQRLVNMPYESDLWDVFQVEHLQRLHQQNYTETIDFLEKFELSEKVKYHSSEGVQLTKPIIDVLYHMLNHSNYHRAQIVLDLKQHNLKHPSFNFISYR
jgi:uncharacterized damage-inducible protein DinB